MAEANEVKQTRLDDFGASVWNKRAKIEGGFALDNRKNLMMRPKRRHVAIEPFESPPAVPQGWVQESMGTVLDTARRVFQDQPLLWGKEEVYRLVTSLCHLGHAEQLFQALRKSMTGEVQHMIHFLDSCIDDTHLLQHVCDTWTGYTARISALRSLVLYLDRTYIYETLPQRGLVELANDVFQSTLCALHGGRLVHDIVTRLIHRLEDRRQTDSKEYAQLDSVFDMFKSLGLYGSICHQRYIDALALYYESEANRHLVGDTLPVYLDHVQDCIERELQYTSGFVDERYQDDIPSTMEHVLVHSNAEALLNKGFEALMDAEDVKHLESLYIVFSRVQREGLIKEAVSSYCTAKGSAIVNEAQDTSMVQTLIAFRNCLSRITQHAFHDDTILSVEIRQSFSVCLNSKGNLVSELMAKYVDELMTSKHASEAEIEKQLDDVMILFRPIYAKDTFEAFFKKDLAKRLLLNRSVSFEVEQLMIRKLQHECGKAFTSDLEGMFSDMTLSQKLCDEFRKRVQLDEQTHLYVLKTSNWPDYKPDQVAMPPAVERMEKQFHEYYTAKSEHNGRKLRWQHALSHGIIRANFPKGAKEFQVSAFQASVLSQFNSQSIYSMSALEQATHMNTADLKQTLMSLLSAKLLQKKPKSTAIALTDHFRINKDYENRSFRVRLNTIQEHETEEEKKNTEAHVNADRRDTLDAVLVRIMKTKKSLSHPLLISECVSQLQFPATPADIKKRIASLLERDYIERDPENPQVYNYLA